MNWTCPPGKFWASAVVGLMVIDWMLRGAWVAVVGLPPHASVNEAAKTSTVMEYVSRQSIKSAFSTSGKSKPLAALGG